MASISTRDALARLHLLETASTEAALAATAAPTGAIRAA
jgi:hypothetical protein